MKDRIRMVMENQHMNQQSFAQLTGIGSASLSSIFNGRTAPTINHAKAIKKCFPNISFNWLILGEGGMFEPVSAVDPDSVSDENKSHVNVQSGIFDSQNKSAILAEGVLDFSADTSAPNVQNSAPNSSRRGGYQMPNQSPQPLRQMQNVSVVATPSRKITEIRVFYDDQTWESFVPKK